MISQKYLNFRTKQNCNNTGQDEPQRFRKPFAVVLACIGSCHCFR